MERVVVGKKSLTAGEAVGLLIAIVVLAVGHFQKPVKIPMNWAIIIAILVLAGFMTLF